MRALRTVAFALLLNAALAQTGTLVVYPFTSQETLLGTAVAERVAAALEGRLEVLGPALAPVFVPPLVSDEGVMSPLLYGPSVSSAASVALLRDIFGADAAVGGEIFIRDEVLEMTLYISYSAAGSPADAASGGAAERLLSYRLQAAQTSPGELAAGTVRLLSSLLGLGRPSAGVLKETAFDLSSGYGDYVRALALIGAGFAAEAAEALEQALAVQAQPSWQAVLDDVRAVQSGREGEDPALLAALALGLSTVSEARASDYMARLAETSSLPVVDLWLALLRFNQGDLARAAEAFERAHYPFALGARALLMSGSEPAAAAEMVRALAATRSPAAALAASLAARRLGDLELERALTAQLSRLAPGLAYGFERLAFIAFEQDDALAAAQALAAATGLEPESDLYWTNLGWAYYLLGMLERSEAASLRALELWDAQAVAWYNLALVQAVTGRLEEAMASYGAALSRDEGVSADAVEDLEEALVRYPEEAGIHFALASLYEAAGRRSQAAQGFRRYLAKGEDAAFLAQAERRAQALRAPAPALGLSPETGLALRPGRPSATSYQPGDRVYPRFEVFTEGLALPPLLTVVLRLLAPDGQVVGEQMRTKEVPSGAVALRIEDLGLELPVGLLSGRYELQLTVFGGDQEVTAVVALEVAGAPSLLRRLVSRGIDLLALDGGASLLPLADLDRQDADARLIAALERELAENADAAEEALPAVGRGRFAGLGGAELFSSAGEEEVQAFLSFLLEGETADASFTFADAYAQWALDGAP
jgi:tetratricopeptide (TPR) repeat protein